MDEAEGEAGSRGELVGVISDTHGLLRPEALNALKGCSLILHAGDVGDAEVLTRLEELAPVVAVRGNMDRGVLARSLPDTQVVEVGGHLLYLLHDLGDLDLSPEGAGLSAVVFGHSHRPETREKDGVLYFNPGSAGHRRFDLPVTVGFLRVREERIQGELAELVKEEP